MGSSLVEEISNALKNSVDKGELADASFTMNFRISCVSMSNILTFLTTLA